MAYPWSAHDILTASDLNAAIGTGIVSTGLGAWTSFTPTLVQSGAVTKTSTVASYVKIGRLCVVNYLLQVIGTGTANNEIRVGVPLTAANAASIPCGVGAVFDNSASSMCKGIAVLDNTSYFTFHDTSLNTNTRLGATGAAMAAALASGDNIYALIAYQTAS